MASAVTLERRARAVALARTGRSYDEIAAELGYANRSGAWKAVQAALTSRISDSVDELRSLEIQRLDSLQAALWDKAESGDVRAGVLVLRIIEQRSRLLGLAPGYGKPDSKPAAPRGVVDARFWEHVRAAHPQSSGWRDCRCETW